MNILETIVAQKRLEVAELPPRSVTAQDLQAALEKRGVRRAVKLPLLRKDFIIDERQILEAVEAGADAILLIAAILSFRQLKHFYGLALEAGLSALVEVHDEPDM